MNFTYSLQIITMQPLTYGIGHLAYFGCSCPVTRVSGAFLGNLSYQAHWKVNTLFDYRLWNCLRAITKTYVGAKAFGQMRKASGTTQILLATRLKCQITLPGRALSQANITWKKKTMNRKTKKKINKTIPTNHHRGSHQITKLVANLREKK